MPKRGKTYLAAKEKVEAGHRYTLSEALELVTSSARGKFDETVEAAVRLGVNPAHADQIYEVLKAWNETYHKTIIVIEHHTEYIAKYCKHVLLLKDGKAAWKLPAREAMRRTEELRESNIFPPQVTITAGRMVQAGMLPEDTTLPVNLEEGKNLFEGYLKNRT